MNVYPMTQQPKKFRTIVLSTHPHFPAAHCYVGFQGSLGFHIYPEYQCETWEDIVDDFVGYVYLGGDDDV